MTEETNLPKVKTENKLGLVQRTVTGIAILSAFFALFNFFLLFYSSLQGLSQKIVEKQNYNSTMMLRNMIFENLEKLNFLTEERNLVLVSLTRDAELNNTSPYLSGQTGANFLAFDLTNNSTSTLVMKDLALPIYVNGGHSTTTFEVTSDFSLAYDSRDQGVFAGDLIISAELYDLTEDKLIATSTVITQEGYLVFNNFNYYLIPQNIQTLVVRGELSTSTPYGLFPDYFSLDLNSSRYKLYFYDQEGLKVTAKPNNLNYRSEPVIYHSIIKE